jgi:DNA-binding MarR family transcriptional regulator
MQYNGGYLLAKINKLTNRLMNDLFKKEDISEFNGAQGTIIYVLTKKGPMPIKDIGRATGLAKTSLTSMLERMEKQGLVEKKENENDRRSTIIGLSEKMKDYVEVLDRIAFAVNEGYYRGMKDEEIEYFEATLEKILHNLEEDVYQNQPDL